MNYEAQLTVYRQDPEDMYLLHEIDDLEYPALTNALMQINPSITLSHSPWGIVESYSEWPNMADDMLELSRRFPPLVFKIFHESPADPEGVMFYFKSGGVQVAQSSIIYDGFDPEKLAYAEEESV